MTWVILTSPDVHWEVTEIYGPYETESEAVEVLNAQGWTRHAAPSKEFSHGDRCAIVEKLERMETDTDAR